MNNVQELLEEMEKVLPVGPETWYMHAITGEEYNVFVIGTKTPNLDKYAEMLAYLWDLFQKQVVDGAVLYWRIKPEYSEWFDEHGNWRAKVYVRYLVSTSDVDPIRETAAPHPPENSAGLVYKSPPEGPHDEGSELEYI